VDTNQSFIVGHSVRDERMPFYPVLEFHTDGTDPDGWEYRRPWAYPETSEVLVDGVDVPTPTATELYEPHASDANAPVGPFKPMRPGPYPEGTTPDEVRNARLKVPGPGVLQGSPGPTRLSLVQPRSTTV
jgi:hypothetical protein